MRFDSDRPNRDLQFELYCDLWVGLGKKILQNYEIFYDEIVNFDVKNNFQKISRICFQNTFQSSLTSTKAFLVIQDFPKNPNYES